MTFKNPTATLRIDRCLIPVLCLGTLFPAAAQTAGPSPPDKATARVGAQATIITEALLKAKPEWRQRPVVDDLRVTALYAQHGAEAVCLLAYDICEILRREVPPLKQAVANALGLSPDRVHIFCSHTHSSSMDDSQHDTAILTAKSVAAAKAARQNAAEVRELGLLRINTGKKFSINRRTNHGELGTWCLMQAQGCVDNGQTVDGTPWVRDKLVSYGASTEEAGAITGPIVADRENDPYLELLLFPKTGGGYAGGLVRFTAHPVVCSAGYWQPNLGRDYPGPLCDRLSEAFECPILFLQGPCGDHRARHRAVGIEERDRIGLGLADLLLAERDTIRIYPFDRLGHAARNVTCPLNKAIPPSEREAKRLEREAKRLLHTLPHGIDRLKTRKDLAEQVAFYNHAAQVLAGSSYLTPQEGKTREAPLTVSCIALGGVHLLNFPGELFSTVSKGLESVDGSPNILVSFADGVTGYLMPREDLAQGAYEATWALFDPESVSALRTVALELLREVQATDKGGEADR